MRWNTFRLMYPMLLNLIGTLFYYIFNNHHYDNSHSTTFVPYYLHYCYDRAFGIVGIWCVLLQQFQSKFRTIFRCMFLG